MKHLQIRRTNYQGSGFKWKISLLTAVLALFLLSGKPAMAQKSKPNLKLIEVKKIWGEAPHSAFTDLIRFNDRWFCVFREAESHISLDGSLRIITSVDGKKWESAAHITSKTMDLRDAKITITSKGQLMLTGAGALFDKSVHTHQSLSWFSEDGFSWSQSHAIGDPDFWLWRTTWHNGKAFSMGYGCNNQRLLKLYTSNDGKSFEMTGSNIYHEGYPNESSIIFSGDTAFCLLRRDGESVNSGLFGISQPPYTTWNWLDLGVRIGGPQMIQLPDGRILATVRLYEGKGWHPAHTSLCWIDPRNSKITEAFVLPSGGDNSYAGMVLYDGLLWVSYYSSHEGKTSIYLAKIKIK